MSRYSMDYRKVLGDGLGATRVLHGNVMETGEENGWRRVESGNRIDFADNAFNRFFRCATMRKNKIAVILAISVLMLASPIISIPRANAFHSGGLSVELTGTVVQGYNDRFLGCCVDAGREGSAVTFNVRILTDSAVGQRNITVGAKFEWQTTWTNASNADDGNTFPLREDQYATFTVSVTLPTLSQTYAGYNLYRHSWEIRVWSGAPNTAITTDNCFDGTLSGCTSWSSGSFAIFSGDMADGVKARSEASTKLSSLQITLGSLSALPPGAGKAASDVSQGSAELSLGDTAYSSGDFAGAKNHYLSALNYANSAAGALGGGDTATFSSTLMNGVGWLLIGVGVILAGFGAFFFFRKRAKA